MAQPPSFRPSDHQTPAASFSLCRLLSNDTSTAMILQMKEFAKSMQMQTVATLWTQTDASVLQNPIKYASSKSKCKL